MAIQSTLTPGGLLPFFEVIKDYYDLAVEADARWLWDNAAELNQSHHWMLKDGMSRFPEEDQSLVDLL